MSPTKTTAKRNVVTLDRENSVSFPASELARLSPSARERLDRLAEVERSSASSDTAYLRANRRWRVGRVVLDRYIVAVPPPIVASSFVDFYIFASGASLSEQREAQRTGGTQLSRIGGHDVFLELMGYRFACATENLIHEGIRRGYVRRRERIRTLRGTPQWNRDFGRHPAAGRTCRYYSFTVDTPLNRAILTGLRAASRILLHKETLGILAGCRRSFSDVAAQTELTDRKAEVLRSRMTRLEDHYEIPLTLSVAFAQNASISDVFASGKGEMPAIEFSLPELFEAFVERCLREGFRGTTVDVRVQFRDRTAIFDGFGAPYREVRPDFVLFRDGLPVAVVDAKFKPRYLRGGATGRLPKRNRVSSRDIYQLSFYQARLQARYSLPEPPRAYIVAPKLDGSERMPGRERRRIRWKDERAAGNGFGLDVLPFPVEAVLTAVKKGGSPASVFRSNSELEDFFASARQIDT